MAMAERSRAFLGVQIALAILHVIGMTLLTVGYFTPIWTLVNWDNIRNTYGYLSANIHRTCYSLGLISNFCDGEYRSLVMRDQSYGKQCLILIY